VRFAFYGRISTSEYQDPVSSRAWQIESAQRVIAGRGRIVAEFFDAGASRSVPWRRRRQAAALLAAAAEPDRGFDAVVVGEFERAFAGGEARRIIETLQGLGVQAWLPEAEGPIDLGDPAHLALLMMLGHQSQREGAARPVPGACGDGGPGPGTGPPSGRPSAVRLPVGGRGPASE
jgi:hypothetical protein